MQLSEHYYLFLIATLDYTVQFLIPHALAVCKWVQCREKGPYLQHFIFFVTYE
jgi:hypothetical protein